MRDVCKQSDSIKKSADRFDQAAASISVSFAFLCEKWLLHKHLPYVTESLNSKDIFLLYK